MDVQINISRGTSVETVAPQDVALTELDREDVRTAVLEAAKRGTYTSGLAEALLADLKTIRDAS